MGMNVTIFERDSTRDCWVNQFKGKMVLITSSITSPMAPLVTFKGELLRIDQFGHRFYAVINQKSPEEDAHEVSFNVDYIMTIEEI